MKKIAYAMILVMILSACSKGASNVTGDSVVKAFKDAGLEAENTYQMVKDDYGLAPFVCTGTRFLIPSLGEDNGGRIFVCDNKKDQQLLSDYYNSLGRASALFFVWVYEKGNVLVEINGDLKEETARKYEQAIP